MIRFLLPYVLYTLVILAAILLQSHLFSSLQIFGVKPDLLMILVIANAIRNDIATGVIVGLMAGLIEDLLVGSYFGLNILVLGLLGGILGYVKNKINLNTFFAHFLAVFAGTMGAGFLYALLLAIVGANVPLGQSIAAIVVPMTFYNLLVLLIVGPLVYYLHLRLGLHLKKVNLLGRGPTLVRRNGAARTGYVRRNVRNGKRRTVRHTKSKFNA